MCSPEAKLQDAKAAKRAATIRLDARTRTGPQQAQLENDQPLPAVPLKSIDVVPEPPTMLARYTCASIIVGFFAVWSKLAFVDESAIPGASSVPLHSWKVPAALTSFYLVSLPLLHLFSRRFLNSRNVDVKLLLKEAMVVYNAGQVALNFWMVCRFISAVYSNGHPLIGGSRDVVSTGATYAVWIHYCDKYLEFFDTYFMLFYRNYT